MTSAAPATVSKQYDAARAAYLKSRKAEVWVKGYVDKMNVMPAKRFVRADTTQDFPGAVEALGHKKAVMIMKDECQMDAI